MELLFNHHKPLTKQQVKEAQQLITLLLAEYKIASGRELATRLDMSPVEVRKVIQNIREHNNELLDPGLFIIATHKGYEITSKKWKINKWAEARRLKAVSGLAQVTQAWKITKEKW